MYFFRLYYKKEKLISIVRNKKCDHMYNVDWNSLIVRVKYT